jgi:hypothetical protein
MLIVTNPPRADGGKPNPKATDVRYARGVGLLLRILAVLLLVRLFFRFLAGVVRGYRGEGAPRSLDMVRDRVCNTFLPRDRALRVLVDGREEHFCSVGCRDRALRPAHP